MDCPRGHVIVSRRARFSLGPAAAGSTGSEGQAPPEPDPPGGISFMIPKPTPERVSVFRVSPRAVRASDTLPAEKGSHSLSLSLSLSVFVSLLLDSSGSCSQTMRHTTSGAGKTLDLAI